MAPPTEHDATSPRHSGSAATVLGQVHSLQHSDEQAHQKRRCTTTTQDEETAAALLDGLVQQGQGDPLMAPLPIAAPVLGESIATFFGRLRGAVDSGAVDTSALRVVDPKDMQQDGDGMYLHKRPVHGADSSSPLTLCGTVLHHCVLYIKQGDELHSLDFGPDNGADVSSNLFVSVPSRAVHHGPRVTVPPEDTLPMLHLGPAPKGWQSDETIQQALRFAESRPYHAVRNNCIHFADFAVRLLTRGSLRGAPLLYDLCSGTVPPVDPPMLAMISMMLQLTWFDVCDGSSLVKAFRAASAPADGRVSVHRLPTAPPGRLPQPLAAASPCGVRPQAAAAAVASGGQRAPATALVGQEATAVATAAAYSTSAPVCTPPAAAAAAAIAAALAAASTSASAAAPVAAQPGSACVGSTTGHAAVAQGHVSIASTAVASAATVIPQQPTSAAVPASAAASNSTAIAAQQKHNASVLFSHIASVMRSAGQEALVQLPELAQALDDAISGGRQAAPKAS